MERQSEFGAAFASLGVTDGTLTAREKSALDDQGFLVLPRVVSAAWMEQLRSAFEALAGGGAESAPGAGRRPTGTRHVEGLLHYGEVFRGIYTNTKLLAAAFHILGRPFRLAGLSGRDPLPGYGAQALHADWVKRDPSEPFYVVNSIWLLDDFTEENGATRVVPGSHLRAGGVPKHLADPASSHPEEVVVTASAGSVLVFNSHLWHSGTQNRSHGSRRTVTCTFAARDAQFMAGAEAMGLGVPDAEWLTPSARYVLGLDVAEEQKSHPSAAAQPEAG
ncbi:MAG TPA: phytanoyl-CoA dioxygenase family protein [Armatimonadota bacterium]|nr:phytanoyl-CoA dioxygenase family protein [Armatimonadota bacterium]